MKALARANLPPAGCCLRRGHRIFVRMPLQSDVRASECQHAAMNALARASLTGTRATRTHRSVVRIGHGRRKRRGTFSKRVCGDREHVHVCPDGKLCCNECAPDGV